MEQDIAGNLPSAMGRSTMEDYQRTWIKTEKHEKEWMGCEMEGSLDTLRLEDTKIQRRYSFKITQLIWGKIPSFQLLTYYTMLLTKYFMFLSFKWIVPIFLTE